MADNQAGRTAGRAPASLGRMDEADLVGEKRVHGDPRGQGIGAKIRPTNRSRASARLDPKADVLSQNAVSGEFQAGGTSTRLRGQMDPVRTAHRLLHFS